MKQVFDIEARIAGSQAWLLDVCRGLTRDRDAADDLAQETLIEAWRHIDRLHAPDAWQPWLAGIARNLHRRRLREAASRRRLLIAIGASGALDDCLTVPENTAEQGVEADELKRLVGDGLVLIPATSRDALVEYLLKERPQGEIAREAGISENAVAARVQRGKRALRGAFEQPSLREAIAAYGFSDGPIDEWRETRITCPLCGRHPLGFRLDPRAKTISVRCTGVCLAQHDGTIIGQASLLPAAERLSSPKALLTRHLLDAHRFYERLLSGQARTCHACGGVLDMQLGAAVSDFDAGVYSRCPSCGFSDDTSLWHLALDRPETIQFWRRHPRMRALPIVALEHQGVPAVATGFESQGGKARIELRYSRSRYRVLAITTAV